MEDDFTHYRVRYLSDGPVERECIVVLNRMCDLNDIRDLIAERKGIGSSIVAIEKMSQDILVDLTSENIEETATDSSLANTNAELRRQCRNFGLDMKDFDLRRGIFTEVLLNEDVYRLVLERVLSRKLSESKLPIPIRRDISDRLRKRGTFTAEEIDAEIHQTRKRWAKMRPTNEESKQ